MSKKEKIIASTMTAFVLLTTTPLLAAAADNATDKAGEKCYGIVKAGQNDCSTAKSSCAGSSTKDKQGDAFLLLPKGACDKIVGGSLKPKA
jgi:uncharacterized membrane protein